MIRSKQSSLEREEGGREREGGREEEREGERKGGRKRERERERERGREREREREREGERGRERRGEIIHVTIKTDHVTHFPIKFSEPQAESLSIFCHDFNMIMFLEKEKKQNSNKKVNTSIIVSLQEKIKIRGLLHRNRTQLRQKYLRLC